MTTEVTLEYLAQLSYELIEWEAPDATEAKPEAELKTESQNDLGFFMTQAGRFELLTAEEERTLGRGLWRARRRVLRILRQARRGGSFPSLEVEDLKRPVTASTRRRLARVEARARSLTSEMADDGSEPLKRLNGTFAEMESLRTELVERNLRLVVWVAKRFRNRGFDFIDLIQEGSLGLMRAIDRFDPAVGARFSTFATHWIQQGIRRALAEKARTIRIPVNRIPEARQALSARSRLAETLKRAPRAEEIANEIGLPTHKVEELLPAIAPLDSTDAPVGLSDRKLGDTLPDKNRPSPLECAIEEERVRAIQEVLCALPERQRTILAMRHGIGYPKECTLEEIGAELGLSRERIRQVEKVASASLKELLEKQRPSLARPI